MGRIAVSALKAGMILSSEVLNDRRQCLAKTGTVVEDRTIRIFQTWGVVEVEVQGVAAPTLEEINARMEASPALQKLSAEIDERFYGASDHPMITELRRVIKQIALDEQTD